MDTAQPLLLISIFFFYTEKTKNLSRFSNYLKDELCLKFPTCTSSSISQTDQRSKKLR